MFLSAAGLEKVVRVRPAEGGNDAATALMSGAASIRVAGQSDSARFVKGGQEKALFVLANDKSKTFPDAAIVPDLGAPKESAILMSSGIWAPKGTPDEIKDLLAEAFRKAIDTPEFQEFMAVQTATPYYLPRGEWNKVFADYEAEYKKILANIKF